MDSNIFSKVSEPQKMSSEVEKMSENLSSLGKRERQRQHIGDGGGENTPLHLRKSIEEGTGR